MLPPDAGLDAPEKGKVTNPNTPIRCICGAKEIIGQTVNEATNRAEQRSRRTGSDVCPQSKPPVPSISEYSAENIWLPPFRKVLIVLWWNQTETQSAMFMIAQGTGAYNPSQKRTTRKTVWQMLMPCKVAAANPPVVLLIIEPHALPQHQTPHGSWRYWRWFSPKHRRSCICGWAETKNHLYAS